jgi:hypothetical protein
MLFQILLCYLGAVPHPRDGVSALAHFDIWEVCHGLLAWLIALNIADLITTRAVLLRGGAESNPFMQTVIDSFVRASLVKGACLALVVALAMRTRRPARAALTLGVVNVWYAVVVVWNCAVLARS